MLEMHAEGRGHLTPSPDSSNSDPHRPCFTHWKISGPMDSNITLWQFLLELLISNQHRDIIQWTNNEGEFKLINAEEVARLWGLRKNKHNMNYDKLSRALRYYYDKNIIKKVMGQKFVYKFVSFPEVTKTESKVPFKVKMESLTSQTAFKTPSYVPSHYSPFDARLSASLSPPEPWRPFPGHLALRPPSPQDRPKDLSPQNRPSSEGSSRGLKRERARSPSPARLSPSQRVLSEPSLSSFSTTAAHRRRPYPLHIENLITPPTTAHSMDSLHGISPSFKVPYTSVPTPVFLPTSPLVAPFPLSFWSSLSPLLNPSSHHLNHFQFPGYLQRPILSSGLTPALSPVSHSHSLPFLPTTDIRTPLFAPSKPVSVQ